MLELSRTDFEMKLEEISLKILENPNKRGVGFKKNNYVNDSLRSFFADASPKLKSFHVNDKSKYTRDQFKNVYFGANLVEKKKKKSVRFADTLGLSLVRVRFILTQNPVESDDIFDLDETESFESNDDEDGYNSDESLDTFRLSHISFRWGSLFQQPGMNPRFYQILNEKKVHLEFLHTNKNRLEGVIRVLNQHACKRVFLRYTIDEWKHFTDLDCHFCYAINFEKFLTDQCKFSLELEEETILKNLDNYAYYGSTPAPMAFRIEFAICCEFGESPTASNWDNNNESNYSVECYLNNLL